MTTATTPAAGTAPQHPTKGDPRMNSHDARPTRSRRRTASAFLALTALVLGGLAAPTAAQASPGDHYYQIVNKSDQCLVVVGGATEHAALVGVATCTGADHEFWDFQDAGDGYVYAKVKHTGMCLNVAYRGQADPTPIVQATCSNGTNEQWQFRPSEGPWGWMVARHSQKCLDRTGDTVVQWSCHHTWAWWQQWRLSDTGVVVP
jgi:hypothetical protein